MLTTRLAVGVTCQSPGVRGARATLRLIVAAAAVFLLGAAPAALVRHTPHEDVNAVRLAPDFVHDRTAFVVVRSCLFRSTDGGNAWARLSSGLGSRPLNDVAVAALELSGRTVFAAGYEGVFRSIDGGSHWKTVNTGLSVRAYRRVFVSPQFVSDRCAVALDMKGQLYRSTDGGDTWRAAPDEVGGVSVCEWLDNGLWLVTTTGHVFTSKDNGAAWEERGVVPQGVQTTCIAAARGDDVVYIGTQVSGVLCGAGTPLVFSREGGALDGQPVTALALLEDGASTALLASTWRHGVFRHELTSEAWTVYAQGLVTDPQADKFGRPHFSGITCVGALDVFVATFCGVFHSADGGRSWIERPTLPHHLVMGLDVTALGQGHSALALSTYGAGVAITRDGGATWVLGNSGLPATRMMAVALSPQFKSDGLVLAGTFGRVCRSTDGGHHWRAISVDGRSAVEESDSTPSPVVFAWSPAFQTDRTVFVALHPQGMLRSVDAGSTFTPIGVGVVDSCRALAVSPAYARDQTLFALTRAGALRSRNRGASFEPLADARLVASCTLVLSPAFERDQTLFAASSDGVLYSRDAGASWARFDLDVELEIEPIASLAVSPNFAVDREFLAQIRGGDCWLCRDTPGGLVAERGTSAQCGYEFSTLPSFAREVSALVEYSPTYSSDHTVWASDVQHLLRSTDGGRTFAPVARSARYESKLARLVGNWTQVHVTGAGTTDRSSTRGDTATLRFVGTGVVVIGTHGPQRGRAEVLVDGELVETVDQSAESVEAGATTFTATDLEPGVHEITLRVCACEDGVSRTFEIDSFDIALVP